VKRVSLQLLACGSCRHPEAMTRKGASLCAADFPAIVGLIRHPDAGLILFDTGYDPAFFAATRPFPERFYRWATPVRLEPGESAVEQIARLGHAPADVAAIILSHFHGDHVAGLHHFPNAAIHCAEAGLTAIRRGGRLARMRQGLLPALVPEDVARRARFFEQASPVDLPPAFAPFTRGMDLLGDGSLIAVDLPGHCPGHWGLALRLDDDRFAFLIGAAAWSFTAVAAGTPPPRLTTALLGDTSRYRATLDSLHRLHVGGAGVVILPAHCPAAAARFDA
jgi:glyoxylase-like metal-dependent hydrolase (beta-lactamase superfamily II)